MADTPLFRVAQASDVELFLDFMEALYTLDGYGYDREKARAALKPLLGNSDLGRAWFILDEAFVDEIYLREEYRGRGWGKRTMAFLEDAARELGVRALHLGVVEGNDKALRLYEAIGFHKHTSSFLSKWIATDFSKPPSKPRD